MLNSKDNGASCELQIQTAYSGLVNDDAGDMKKRVTESLVRLKDQPLPGAATPDQASTPAASVQASLAIDSTPPGADIEIDGGFVGNTPSTVAVVAGSHQIAVKKKGFSDWTKTINITGGSIHLSADLESLQAPPPTPAPAPASTTVPAANQPPATSPN
jgi:hypothetical protein